LAHQGTTRGPFLLSDAVSIGPITSQQIGQAVQIFLSAFADNVRLVYGDRPKPDAMIDIWSFARDIEPGGFLAASDRDGVLGYALFTSSLRRLQRRALESGQVFVWAARALSGHYGIRWLGVARQLWNKMIFIGDSGRFRHDSAHGDAQLLNIAVAESARGRGIAALLVAGGMRHLASRAISEVRLEVQPHNSPAIAVYRGAGFHDVGKMKNAYGDWLVMTADPMAAGKRDD
jgi:ribosomal protein S18 acetylase RimI-like enzyme